MPPWRGQYNAPRPVLHAGRHSAAAGVALPTNQFFSIRYQVDNALGPVSCSYVCEQAGDTVSTPFSVVSTQNLHFADGYLDPAKAGSTYSEIISILNPYAVQGRG